MNPIHLLQARSAQQLKMEALGVIKIEDDEIFYLILLANMASKIAVHAFFL